MQKRIIRKLDLERFLSQIEPNPWPKSALEQYTVPVDVAATMLFIAAYTRNDIQGMSVSDLGCGTGRLALGAAYLGAKRIVGVDIDKSVVKLASRYSAQLGLKKKTNWIAADISALTGRFDVVLENPPFGVQRRHADLIFLKKALAMANVVYSLHKSSRNDKVFFPDLKARHDMTASGDPARFLEKFVEDHGGRIQAVYTMLMTIPHMFPFHTSKKHQFAVDLYIIRTRAE